MQAVHWAERNRRFLRAELVQAGHKSSERTLHIQDRRIIVPGLDGRSGMKRKSIFSAILLVCTAWAAHTGSTGPAQQTAATSSHSSSKSASTQNPNSDQQMSAHQTLEPEMRQDFWGTINPFARKKYVRRRLSPIRNRVNELDDLTAANAKAIKDVDARAQEGIRQATAKADRADQHAIDAGNRAQQANQAALQASHRLNTVEQVVVNIDQYQLGAQIDLIGLTSMRLTPATALSRRTRPPFRPAIV